MKLNNAKLLFQLVQLLQADVVAATHHNDHRAQVLRQLALIPQPFDNATVHRCQSSTTGRLHQDLLIICTGRISGEICDQIGHFKSVVCLFRLYSPTKRSTAFTASWSVTTSDRIGCSCDSFIVCAETFATPSVVATL